MRTQRGVEPSHELTIIITTSPIPSMPSTALLAALLHSLDAVEELSGCAAIIVCDAIGTVGAGPPNYKRSCVMAEQVPLYSEYIGNVRALASRQTRPCKVLVLSAWHGCALAVKAALDDGVASSCRFVMLVQHDQLFLRGFDVCGVLAAMNAHPDVLKYVGLPSRTTLRYEERVAERFGLHLEPLQVPELSTPLLPLCMWYDKPHITWVEHLREHIYAEREEKDGSGPTRPFRPGDFVEDVFGRAQLEIVKRDGLGCLSGYGTWVLKVEDEEEGPVTYHCSGRKVQAGSAEDSADGGALDCRARIRAAPSATSAACVAAARSAAPSATSAACVAAVHRTACMWSEGSSTSIHAAVPGLAAPPVARGTVDPAADQALAARPTARFKGTCFRCKAKGHSFRYCPTMETTPLEAATAVEVDPDG